MFNGFGLIVLDVKRENIEKKKMNRINQFVKDLESLGKDGFQRGGITFGGYESDPREIFEIDEIREWCLKVIQNHPHIFYFITPMVDFFQNLVICIADVEAIQLGQKKSLVEWMNEGYDPLDERLPKIELKVNIPDHILKHLEKGLRNYGGKVRDKERVEDVIEHLRYFTNGNKE